MSVSIVSTAAAQVVNLSEARSNLVNAAKKTGGVILTYAQGLNASFDLLDNSGNVTTKWFDLKGKLKAGVNDERALFVAAFTAAGFGKPTIDVYWQRVKEASGYVTANNRVKGEASVDEKTLADLKTIINRIFKAEEKGDSSCAKASDVKGKLMDAFDFMGGDVDTLG
jgi:hypothetical protein